MKTNQVLRSLMGALCLVLASTMALADIPTTNATPAKVLNCAQCRDTKKCSSCEGSGTTKCTRCDGKGKSETRCSRCGGDGRVSKTTRTNGKTRRTTSSCSSCGGRGKRTPNCTTCGGDGKIDCSKCEGTKECPACKPRP